MDRRTFLGTLTGGLLGAPLAAEAQQAGKVYRVGVVLQGGPYFGAVDGLRRGLAELGLAEGTQVILHVREGRGDLQAVERAAGNLEREKVDLIYAVGTSVTIAVKRATKTVPIVFYAGGDPVAFGLVGSFRKPGGRLTGVYSGFTTELTAKRPRAKKVPAIFSQEDSAVEGGLASYGASFSAMGRLGAKYVQRILLGADPGELPVERVDQLYFVINLKTARALGLTIPPSPLARADQVIERWTGERSLAP